MQSYVTIPVTLVTSLQRKFHLRVAEWITSAIMVSFGVELSLDPTMFHDSPFFSEIARFAAQRLWAVTLLLIGFTRLSALFINGAWRLSPHVRAIASGMAFLIWLEIVIGIAHLSKPTLGLVAYPWLAAADFYAIFRGASDARLADEQAKVIAAARGA